MAPRAITLLPAPLDSPRTRHATVLILILPTTSALGPFLILRESGWQPQWRIDQSGSAINQIPREATTHQSRDVSWLGFQQLAVRF